MEEHLTKEERKQLRKQEWQEKITSEERKKRFSRIAWWVGGALLLIFAVWFIVSVMNTPTATTAALTAPGPKPTDMTYGNPKSKVVLTEYADFQCPGCGAYYPIVKQLTQQYKDKILFVYRFFPLTQIHQNALVASEAGYAAALQGKFWPMHDLLFAHQNDWATLADPSNDFIAYAQEAGLNIDQFKKDYTSDKVANYIKSQEQAALDLGLPGTPSFFLNGKQIANPPTYADFQKLIDDALAQAK